MRVFLVGFMGSGKSTIGRSLALRSGAQFLDLDDLIVESARCTIAEIFDREGEAHFRRLEHQALASICHQPIKPRTADSGQRTAGCIIALGGGAFIQPVNRDLIARSGVSVWLDTPFETCACRLAEATDRPLFRQPETAHVLYLERRPRYALADIQLDTDGLTVEAITDAILAQLWNRQPPLASGK